MEKALRVCLISREYPPDTGFGGIATFSKHLAYGLTGLGHQVHVITLAKDKAKTYSEDGICVHRVMPYFNEHTLNLIDCAMPYSKYVISTSSALWEKFIELHDNEAFDVIDTPELLAEGFYPAITKIAPLVIRLYTPHSKFIAERLHNVTPTFDHQFVAMVERMAMIYADVLTSPSTDLAQFVANDLNYPVDRIKFVPNPIDVDVFTPDGDKTIVDKGCLKVLFVGRLEERKGITYLIESWKDVIAQVPTARLYVIGDDTKTAKGQTSVLAQLKKYISKHRLEKDITFIDRVPLSELPAYYRSADICIVPSVYDNSPYTCLEAMSCGKAVVGTAAGGTKEYIVDGESGVIIAPRDSASIAHALITLLHDAKERERLGNNARNRVLMQFQKREVARQMVQLYEQAIDSFAMRRKLLSENSLYMPPAQNVLSDMEEITGGFNEMLHRFLYEWSYEYRIRTRFRQVKSRPRLYLAKFLLRLVKGLSFWTAGDENKLPAFYHNLQKTVVQRQERDKKESRLAQRMNKNLTSSTEAESCQKQCV